jgi:hypothetical protein
MGAHCPRDALCSGGWKRLRRSTCSPAVESPRTDCLAPAPPDLHTGATDASPGLAWNAPTPHGQSVKLRHRMPLPCSRGRGPLGQGGAGQSTHGLSGRRSLSPSGSRGSVSLTSLLRS